MVEHDSNVVHEGYKLGQSRYNKELVANIAAENENTPKLSVRLRSVAGVSNSKRGRLRPSDSDRQAEIDRPVRRFLPDVDQILRGKGKYVMQCLSCNDLAILGWEQ